MQQNVQNIELFDLHTIHLILYHNMLFTACGSQYHMLPCQCMKQPSIIFYLDVEFIVIVHYHSHIHIDVQGRAWCNVSLYTYITEIFYTIFNISLFFIDTNCTCPQRHMYMHNFESTQSEHLNVTTEEEVVTQQLLFSCFAILLCTICSVHSLCKVQDTI